MTVEAFKEFQLSLPKQPGVYRFIGPDEEVLYVGKAKNLLNRVTSYFVGMHDKSTRHKIMIRLAERIEFTIVNTERDALILENSLIKSYQPRYNILLKDDKTYPLICIGNERFPKVFTARKVTPDGSKFFGPFPSVGAVYTLIELFHKEFKIRTCNLTLNDYQIKANKFQVCLEYHIGNCKGPCVGLQSQEEYDENISQIRQILKGQTSSVIQHLTEKMMSAAEKLEFEKAHQLKTKIQALQKFRDTSTLVKPEITNIDVFGMVSEGQHNFVNFMRIVQGSAVATQTIELKPQLDESKEELLAYAVLHLRQLHRSPSTEVVVPFEVELSDPDIEVTVPQRGDKKHLLDLCQKNALYYKNKKLAGEMNIKIKTEEFSVLKELQKEFRLTELPMHIECFDNSNFQGDYPVSAMVVFKNGKPSKKDYRHFNVKTVEGPNDFATMEEVVFRRYKRMIEEAAPLPQLILIDGGKGQLSAAYESLKKLGLIGKVALASIAKRLEEIYVPNDPVPLHISKKSPALRVIQHLRDEAHRFGITHHRSRRDKATLIPELTKIKGIGPETNTALLKKFRSVANVKAATLDALAEIVGVQKAKIIKAHFK